MLSLLTLVRLQSPSPDRWSNSRNWSSAQQEALQLHALATLATVAPLLLDDYLLCQGNSCLLLLLDWCIKPSEKKVIREGTEIVKIEVLGRSDKGTTLLLSPRRALRSRQQCPQGT